MSQCICETNTSCNAKKHYCVCNIVGHNYCRSMESHNCGWDLFSKTLCKWHMGCRRCFLFSCSK